MYDVYISRTKWMNFFEPIPQLALFAIYFCAIENLSASTAGTSKNQHKRFGDLKDLLCELKRLKSLTFHQKHFSRDFIKI